MPQKVIEKEPLPKNKYTESTTEDSILGISRPNNRDDESMPSLQSRDRSSASESEDNSTIEATDNRKDYKQISQISHNTNIGIFQQSEADDDNDESDDSSRPRSTHHQSRAHQPWPNKTENRTQPTQKRQIIHKNSDKEEARQQQTNPRTQPLFPTGFSQGQNTPNSDDWIDNDEQYTQAPPETDRTTPTETTKTQTFAIKTISFPSDATAREDNSSQPEVGSENQQVLDTWRDIFKRPVHPPGPALAAEPPVEAANTETVETPPEEPRVQRFRQGKIQSLAPDKNVPFGDPRREKTPGFDRLVWCNPNGTSHHRALLEFSRDHPEYARCRNRYVGASRNQPRLAPPRNT
jgi:hypothetical protein